MKFNKTNVCLGAVLVFLGACAAPKPGTPEFVQKKEDEQQKAVTQAVGRTITNIPSWFTQPPVDLNSFYQTGSEVSQDLQQSIDDAVLGARSQLALRLANRATVIIQSFGNQTRTGDDEQINRLINTTRSNIAKDVNLAGYVVEKSEVIQEGNRYRSFVLVRYPLGENNKVVIDQIKKDSAAEFKLKASKAFQDLEREIEAAKKK